MNLDERLKNLRAGEALNVTETTPEGKGIRKLSFNPQSSRSLVEVPFNPGFVFNLEKNEEGLKNFLRFRGYSDSRINKVLENIFKIKVKKTKKSSPSSELNLDQTYIFKIKREDPQFEEIRETLTAQVLEKEKIGKNKIVYRLRALKVPQGFDNYIERDGTFIADIDYNLKNPTISVGDLDYSLEPFI